MNKFEKYWWNSGINNSLFGAKFLFRQELIRFVKLLVPKFLFKFLKIKKQYRVNEFMGGDLNETVYEKAKTNSIRNA